MIQDLIPKQRNNYTISKQTASVLKTINQILSLPISPQTDPEITDSLARGCRELLLLGRLLDKCYIHSTDIEYAQFYNKELALRVEQFRLELLQTELEVFNGLEEATAQAFTKLELKKSQYFKENAKEMSQSNNLLRSLNVNLKDENEHLQEEMSKLKRDLNDLKPKYDQLSKTFEQAQIDLGKLFQNIIY